MVHPIVDTAQIRRLLARHAPMAKGYLRHCVHCALCAESCFLYLRHDRDPRYMPAYKVIHSVGRLYRRRGRVDRAMLEEIKRIAWHDCVLCGRCYCPVGVSVPQLIVLARRVCRSQGVFPGFDDLGVQQSWL